MRLIKSIFSRLGYQLVRKQKDLGNVSKNRAENYPRWFEEAKALGEDVNDYIVRTTGNPLDVLDKIVFPYITSQTSAVIELGPGTGRFTREIIKKIEQNPNWKLYLIDHSQWIVTFLTGYFEKYDRVYPILNDGLHYPSIQDNSIDMIFINGVFVELNLSRFYTYCNESYRVLRPGGYLIFNYLDINYEKGWEHMKKFSVNPDFSYSYFTGETIDKMFIGKGFKLINRSPLGNSAYVVYQKP